MLREDQHSSGHRSTEQSSATNRSVTRRSEEIHIRNLDINQAYDLTIEVHDSEGPVFANRYYLTPGKTVSELGRLPPGEYELRVELDSRRKKKLQPVKLTERLTGRH